MLELVLILLAVAILVWNRSLARRLKRLESSVDTLRDKVFTLETSATRAVAPEAAPAPAELALQPQAVVEGLATQTSEAIAAPGPVLAELSEAPVPAPPLPVPPAPIPPAPRQDRAIVFTPEMSDRLMRFLRENWVYVISAISLALAGVFLVQYGIEQGLISPTVRVLGAIALGAALIGTGEYLRRRFGDAPDSTVAYLPSTFSGAGVVVVFAAVMAARHLYGLIGPNVTMGGYVLTALVAMVLGWFNGAFLVAIGLIGAAAAPFLVGGDTEPASWLYLYYSLVTVLGLAVDTVRRWAWVSVLALVLGFGGGLAMRTIGAGAEGWLLFLVALPLLATALPDRSVVPRHAGPATSLAFAAKGLPLFPVRLVVGSLLASSVLLLSELSGLPDQAFLVFVALTFLTLVYLFWAETAEGLADVAALPALAFLLGLVLVAAGYMPLFNDYWALNLQDRAPELPAPKIVTYLTAMAVVMSLAAAWRALRPSALAIPMGIAAVLTAPLAVILLDRRWLPAEVIGAFPWALHAIVVAALMVALAARFAAKDGEDHRRAAHATLAALSMIALALFTLTSATPLTLALAVLVVVAAGLDARFRLPEMTIFIQLGAAVLTFRLLIDPGLFWAEEAPLLEVILAFLGPIAAGVACLWLYRVLERPITRGVVETAALLWLLMLADTLLGRWITDGLHMDSGSHWGISLLGMPWLGMALVQIWRSQLGGVLARLRRWLSVFYGILAGVALLVAATVLNPLFSYQYDDTGFVRGPMILDTLALAYLVPALVLFVGTLRLGFLKTLTRRGLYAASGALTLLYVGLEIRRFWQGDWLGGTEVAQGELYTYTLALMLIGAGLLYAAIARRSQTLRKIAMAVITVTIAKVFLIDASGLTGLTRVMSFLGLGLSLAGVAWLNRWAGQVSGGVKDVPKAET